MRPRDLPSNFRATVLLCNLSAYVNFTFVRRTICQLSVQQSDIPSIFVHPRDSSPTFSAFAGSSVSFHQLSVRPLNIPSTSINIPCGHGTFHQFSVQLRDLSPTFRASEGPSINFPYVRGRSVNFCQLSVWLRDYQIFMCQRNILSSSANIRAASGPSINLRQLSMRLQNLLSTSVNFPCIHVTFRQLASTFCASVGHSVIFPFIRGTFRQLWSILRVSTVPSVNFRELFVHPWDLP